MTYYFCYKYILNYTITVQNAFLIRNTGEKMKKSKKTKSDVIDFEELLFGDIDYHQFKEDLKDAILDGINEEECFKDQTVKVKLGDEIIECTNAELAVNCIFMQFLGSQEDSLAREIFEVSSQFWYTADRFGTEIEQYWDAVIPLVLRIGGDSINVEGLNTSISESIAEYGDFLLYLNMLYGSTVNLYEFMKAIDENPELKELTSGDVSNINEYSEITAEISRRRKRFEEIIDNDPKLKKLSLFLKCNNSGQYEQMFIGIGPKADIFGHIMEHVPNTNFLKGMENVDDFYTLSQTTRKILIITHKSVSSSGYLARKLGLLLTDTDLDIPEPKKKKKKDKDKKVKKTFSDTNDCETKHYLEVLVDSEATLKRLKYRFYKLNRDDKKLKMINADESDLIGKVIYLRSPITCADANGICKTCYGSLYIINKRLHIGYLAALYLTSVLTQRLLSAKHLIKTKALDVKWTNAELELFNIEKSEVFSSNADTNVVLLLKQEDITEDEDTGQYYTDVLYVMKGKQEPKPLNLSDSFWLSADLLENISDYKVTGGYEIKLKDWFDRPAFELLVKNEEMTTSLNKIKKIIDNKDHLGIDGSYNEIYRAIIDILNTNRISIDSVHVELIIRELLVDAEENSHRPDFKDEKMIPRLLRLSDVIFKRDTLSPSLAFEHIDKQLNDANTFRKRGKSNMDSFFKI